MTRDTPATDWLPAVRAAFERTLGDDAYPCDFGVRAHRAGDNTYAALDRRDPARHGVRALAAALDDFKVRARTGPPRQSLIVFDGPPAPAHLAAPDRRLAEDRRRFWHLLGDLSRLDDREWPEEVPDDPADPRWQWCYGGEPWFVFALSPGYARRGSRRAPCLTLVFQTRRVFTGLSGATPAGRAAKRRIRARLSGYDPVPPHPHLGDAGGSSTHKWRQYVLPDDQTILPEDGCPFPGHLADTTGDTP
ncbi:YqcI/YcgG family protein [Sphaerisporangium aureirubrum]|uniref:YqcI/YcgG family protein n=1 Tax=Sphaerisporangium aureirubrum TaxID=1544736 RepID=A0ABW1NM70_9ACTN